MDSELMEEILRTLNRKCEAEDRKILFFIDNAPSHPESYIDCFFFLKIAFLPKNITSKLQSLDAGIIVCKASDVISSVDLLKSIE